MLSMMLESFSSSGEKSRQRPPGEMDSIVKIAIGFENAAGFLG